MRIAIIDDTNFHLKNLSLKLKKIGYTDILEINTSTSNDIFSINFNCIDVVFLDVMMPRIDAIDVINLCLKKKNKLLIFSSARKELINVTYEFAKIKGYDCIGCIDKDVSTVELKVILNSIVLKKSKHEEDYEILAYEAVKGIFNGSLISYYQPKVDAYSLNIVGLEALARLSHEKYGLLTPEKFIETYEKYGLLTMLFYTQLEECCRFFEEKKLDLYLSVNIPHSTLMSEAKLHEKVKSICDVYSFTTEKLILEITESQIYSPNSYELENISKLSMLGVKFSLDDFGSGYSTLKSMNQIPFYEVKIDKFSSTAYKKTKN
ncbi:diguanylate cyclase [Vibrio ponticus]|nr:diguanylate cyclase [Vibrio ponticus]